MAAVPDLGTQIQRRQPRLLGHLAKRRFTGILALMQAASGCKPKYLSGLGSLGTKEQEPLLLIEQEHSRGPTQPQSLAHSHKLLSEEAKASDEKARRSDKAESARLI
jgi:hypothetical protein